MPGTIQVSVLEFMGLQPSSTPSQMSIKVSLGKKEYQTTDKGDFSFPLTTLRDKLIVTLQDAEGKQISNTVVETKLVIEKGIWDDIFPLQGGGHVHMKLQFVLSEEDRHRIRIMRESALRKKHEELLKSEVRSPPHATSVGSNVTSSLQLYHEVSDSHKSHLESEVIQAALRSTDPSILLNNEKSDPEDKEGSHSVQKQTKPNDTDTYADSSSTKPAKPKEYGANELENQSTREKTPSKIRNMISAFENSLNQERTQIRSPSIKPQPGKTRVEVSSSRHLNEVMVENAELAQLSGSVRKAIHTRDLQQAPSHIRKREQTGFQTKARTTDMNERGTVMQKVEIEKEKTSSEDFARSSTSERASVSGRMQNEKGAYPSGNLFGSRRISSDKVLKQRTGQGIQPKDLQQVNNQDIGPSVHEHYSFECNGAWIFPDGGKRLCITTSGKQIMNLMGSIFIEAKNQLGKLGSPVAENVKQVKEDGETSQRSEEPKLEDSTETETPRGPVGQVMRVAIMVGFATLVLVTRQRKSDK